MTQTEFFQIRITDESVVVGCFCAKTDAVAPIRQFFLNPFVQLVICALTPLQKIRDGLGRIIVRRGNQSLTALPDLFPQHPNRHLQIFGAVVHARQNMQMQIIKWFLFLSEQHNYFL